MLALDQTANAATRSPRSRATQDCSFECTLARRAGGAERAKPELRRRAGAPPGAAADKLAKYPASTEAR